MPIYDYVCAQCGRRIEVIHGVHAAGPTQCEQCGGALRKAVSVPAILFKGSGWAKVDARAASSRAPSGDGAAKSDKSDKPEGDGAAKSPDSSAPATDKAGASTTAEPAAGSADAKGTSG